jgi:hypothetical protein
MMKTIWNTDLQKLISAQKDNVPALVKKHKPTDAEQGMYIAFRIANRCIEECPKAKLYWRDVKSILPKNDGLFLVTGKSATGEIKVRAAWYVKGEWKGKFNVTHWTPMPQPYKENTDG